MKLSEHKNSKFQGNAGVGSAIGFFTKIGWVVSIPLTDAQDYDLIIDIDGDLKKVQVKTTTSIAPSKAYKVDLRTNGGNRSRNYNKKFDGSKIDYIFLFTENGDKYFIPTKDMENMSSITLGEKYNKYLIG